MSKFALTHPTEFSCTLFRRYQNTNNDSDILHAFTMDCRYMGAVLIIFFNFILTDFFFSFFFLSSSDDFFSVNLTFARKIWKKLHTSLPRSKIASLTLSCSTPCYYCLFKDNFRLRCLPIFSAQVKKIWSKREERSSQRYTLFTLLYFPFCPA